MADEEIDKGGSRRCTGEALDALAEELRRTVAVPK
jgi:hypothetical protein